MLSNDVLNTALTVVLGLPPLSLSNSNKIPDVGIKTLEQVSDFLSQCSKLKTTGDERGSKICLELLLCLAVQRGSLSHLLKWINTALLVAREENSCPQKRRSISKSSIDLALSQIRGVTGFSTEDSRHLARYNLACSANSAHSFDQEVDLYEAVLCLAAEVRNVHAYCSKFLYFK